MFGSRSWPYLYLLRNGYLEMVLLAKGYQYKVYDIGNGRVRKIPQSHWYSIRMMLKVEKKEAGRTFFPALGVAFREVRRCRKTIREIRRRLADGSLPASMFGNPMFAGNSMVFEQDKVAMIEEILAANEFDVSKKIIDGYTEFQKKLWSFGIHDPVFKFQPNYGVADGGDIVCIDFGEMVFTKKEALASMEKRKWLSLPSYRKWSDGPLKSYYTQAMEGLMTEANLNRYWQTTDGLLK